MLILGIDPGLATVGIGIIESDAKEALRVIDYCTIETAKGNANADRLHEIANDLSSIIRKHHPSIAVIEKLYFETNQKTAMAVAEARGVILLTCANEGLSIIEPTPLELKVAVTGDGKADKRQMQNMINRMLGLDSLSDDVADALGLAIYGSLMHSSQVVLP